MRLVIDTVASRWRRRAVRARLERHLGLPAGSMAPGPIAARPLAGLPPLSWLPPAAGHCRGPFIDALDDRLRSKCDIDASPSVTALMSRVLASDALHVRSRIVSLPTELVCNAKRPSVLLIDERVHSDTAPGSRPRQRVRLFRDMVTRVRNLDRDASVWIMRSNDPGSGPWLSSRVPLPHDTRHLDTNTSLRDLLQHIERVYVVTASEGIGALLANVPLHVFGHPHYAGWGLTIDAQPMPARIARPTVAALFEALLVERVRYLDPTTCGVGTLDALLDFIDLQHAVARRFVDLDRLAGIRFQLWKRPFATPYLTAGGGQLRWTNGIHPPRQGEFAAFWGARTTGQLSGTPCVRIEDGFIHSAGLGSDMSPPCSQVVDRQGIYFDASRPNDLTDLLNHDTFDDAELARAAALRRAIVEAGLTKYNLGRKAPSWRAPDGHTIVLVPGQVADDASIRLGTRGINSLDALLQRVRERRPDAFIVYKPHPDVLSGNRRGIVDAACLADVVDAESDMISLIEIADEVHTLSSLAGFDALLRGKMVCTYGLPFYAGWGLTDDDLAPLPWRDRVLSLDMLVAGALLRYPLYWDWHLHLYTTPEAVVGQLSAAAARPLRTIANDRWRRYIKAYRWTRNVVRHFSWRYRHTTTRNSSL
ncbi:capsular biosynthesis protein [Burkholderia cenocepacia]|uniref:capsular polysaccharide export protein, LipB/KpsS family n=1 Tax=Burkholderia cenocepacia TaxID=95486 RepID=UPI0007568E07|nr:capsular biosynthesis protein [Burkholderia cenocepacia]KWF17189.1 capsular biosynthesis protein [Burkholderia cenocepacia]MBR8271315.1 capsular biosynthesis protein [Burkholderia cenocepacia]